MSKVKFASSLCQRISDDFDHYCASYTKHGYYRHLYYAAFASSLLLDLSVDVDDLYFALREWLSCGTVPGDIYAFSVYLHSRL